jgi:hypothetical protein
MSGCFTVILHAHQNHAVTDRIKLLPQIGRPLGLADSEFANQSLMMPDATVASISVESPTSHQQVHALNTCVTARFNMMVTPSCTGWEDSRPRVRLVWHCFPGTVVVGCYAGDLSNSLTRCSASMRYNVKTHNTVKNCLSGLQQTRHNTGCPHAHVRCTVLVPTVLYSCTYLC